MKSVKALTLLTSAAILFGSCASIVSKSVYPISINSTPSESNITITDKKGEEIYTGNTPASLTLKAGAGYFSKANYLVKFEKAGYETKVVPIKFTLDGWYVGNLLFGGLLGFLIIDPATGAMYKLESDFLNTTLIQATAMNNSSEIKMIDINEIPKSWDDHLVLVSE